MRSRSRGDEIRVGVPTLSRTTDGRSRVDVDVDGIEVYLAADAPLATNGDAWASMMLLPAAKSRGTLRVDADLDARLAANFGRIQATAREFWGFAGAAVVPRGAVERAPAGGSAMFFTCGVDSFHTLRRHRGSIERLIFVRGLNINLTDLADDARFAPVRAGIEAVARELGIEVVFAESNLRSHPTFGRVGWDVSHLGALAGVAHALAPVVSRVYVASSDIPAPYGSRPDLDPLWSSGAVEIVNDGSETFKPEKVRAIADWPLVHRHLRVCHSTRGNELNCGACFKCVRTQLLFAIAGARERLETFPQTPLTELIDGIPWVEEEYHPLWTMLYGQIRDPAIIAAIERLVARRPSAVERLQASAPWLRKTAPGRAIRKLAKRLLVR